MNWRVIQGDCLAVMRDFAPGSFDAVITDIPYGEVNRPSQGLRVFDKGIADVANFDVATVAGEFVRLTRGSVYVFCCTEQVSVLRGAFVAAGLSSRLCIWQKPSPSPTNGQHLWLSDIECCVFGKKPGAVFNYLCRSAVWRFGSDGNEHHTTQKPVNLMRYLVNASTEPGQRVLDSFCGSGTTGVACAELGRDFCGIEIDPGYCAIARKRIEAATRQGRLAL